MTAISPYKQSIANGHIPHGMSEQKATKIAKQVAYRGQMLEILRKWSPKTARQDRRKKNQVGS